MATGDEGFKLGLVGVVTDVSFFEFIYEFLPQCADDGSYRPGHWANTFDVVCVGCVNGARDLSGFLRGWRIRVGEFGD